MQQNIRDIIKVELERVDNKRMFFYLILGYQVYGAISCLCTLFMVYDKHDDVKESQYSRRKLLREYSKEMNQPDILSDVMENDTFPQIFCEYVVFVILGIHYEKKGFDGVYNFFRNMILKGYSQRIAYLTAHQHDASLLEGLVVNISKNLGSFIFENIDVKLDPLYNDFSERYGVGALLLCLVTNSKSRIWRNFWEKIKSRTQFLTYKDILKVRDKLVQSGHYLITLQALRFNVLNDGNFNFRIFSLPKFSNQMLYDSYEFSRKVFDINGLEILLFDKLGIPSIGNLTLLDKRDIIAGFISAFFISNFSPDVKFFNEFGNVFDTFYLDGNKEIEIDYRYAVISYLSMFDLEPIINHHEIGNGIFRAEVSFGEENDLLDFICDNESMRVWYQIYKSIIIEIKEFFSSPRNCEYDIKSILFFIKKIVNIKEQDFISDFGILSSINFSKFTLDDCKKILYKVKLITSDDLLYQKFIKKIAELNTDKFVCFNDKVYMYSSLFFSEFLIDRVLPIGIERFDEELYKNVVNPSMEFQKRIIDKDYKSVRIMNPLSDEVAIYALDKNIDSYNYFTSVSHEVSEYYLMKQKEKAEAEDKFINIDDNIVFSECTLDDTKVIIIDSHKPFSQQLEYLISNLELKYVVMACGYCFNSGLSLLKTVIDRSIYSNIPFDLYVGALQDYNEEEHDKIITGIDKQTVKRLNEFLTHANFSLYTCSKRFYHGKLFFFEGVDETVICIGSSNISKSAFINNYELNIAFRITTNSDLYIRIKSWIEQLKGYSSKLNHLEEAVFVDNELNQINNVVIKDVSLSKMQERIDNLTNEEIRYRLNLWMSYNPDIIAENLGILALPNYFVFVYKERKLMVLESLEAGNSYFCIRFENSFEEAINSISTFSKTEIFTYSKMDKRGYHLQNKISLEGNIRKIFNR